VRKDGSRFWASGAVMSMRDGGDKVVGLVKVLRDESPTRAAHEALEHREVDLLKTLDAKELDRSALVTANAAKDRFLAVLSQELRTPLAPIISTVQMLSRRGGLSPDVRRALEMIRRNVKIETHLVDDLLDLTRIARGSFEIAHDKVDLRQIVHDALEVCDDEIGARQQALQLSLDADRHDVLGDGPRLQQVIWNLLKNASRFTPPRGSIAVRSRSVPGRLFISVADTGIGMEPTALTQIFQAFTQAGDWVAREHGGLGLGLAISKATVEAHGGTLAASSPGRGQGSTFVVELPLEPSDESRPIAAHPAG
jgi:two-component system CheB/CheR fusion protein